MIADILLKFNSVKDLQSNIEKNIELLEKNINNMSNDLGEKIRMNSDENKNDPEFMELKQKLDGANNTEKKKKPSKKKSNSLWYDVEGIKIYNGMGVNGELELYFKGIDELKNKLELLQSTKKTLNMIVEKGLKEDMGCMVFQNNSEPFEIVFTKNARRKKFSFQTTYSAEPEKSENLIGMENK